MATAWLTAEDVDELAVLWPDSDTIEAEDVLNLYLSAAKAGCLAFAPELPEGDPIPDEWLIAQAYHARNTYNAGQAAPSGEFDGSSYGLTAFPLDWQVKQLLRPQSAVGAIW